MLIYEKYPEKKQPKTQQRPGSWRAVSVVATDECCQAAKQCAGTRYLIADVPRLPLPECTATHCACKYRHYEDRRVTPRRSNELGGVPKRRVLIDRRAQNSRRSPET